MVILWASLELRTKVVQVSNQLIYCSYVPRDPSLTSETYHCKRGVNQIFSQSSHIFNPNLFSDDDLCYNAERDVFPVAIHCVVEDGSEGILYIIYLY